MAKNKYYVVWIGQNPGIYTSWAECLAEVKGYQGAKYKAFKTQAEAEEDYYGNYQDFMAKKAGGTTKKTVSEEARQAIVWDSISVDAACSGNPGKMEYRGVDTKTGMEIFRMGPFDRGTNNVGEFLALVHGLAHLKREGSQLPIYSDSRIAIGWIRKKKAATKLAKTRANARWYPLIARAEAWLNANTFTTKIMKWETKEWGEIPADFGRK